MLLGTGVFSSASGTCFFALGVRGRAVQGPLWAAGLFLCLHCGFLEGGSMWVGGGHTVGSL